MSDSVRKAKNPDGAVAVSSGREAALNNLGKVSGVEK